MHHPSPACISPGVALELHSNGFQAARAIAILQAITGNLDVSGGALFLTEAQLSDMSVANQMRSAKPAIGQNEYPLFHKSTGHAQANLYADAILRRQTLSDQGACDCWQQPCSDVAQCQKGAASIRETGIPCGDGPLHDPDR